MQRLFILLIVLLLVGCANLSKFEKQCQSYGFSSDSADYTVCVERETRKVRDYLDDRAAEERAKRESFHRDLRRKELGLDIK